MLSDFCQILMATGCFFFFFQNSGIDIHQSVSQTVWIHIKTNLLLGLLLGLIWVQFPISKNYQKMTLAGKELIQNVSKSTVK